MINIRIFFSKTDRAKYISHLDLNRCMARAFQRSGLPLWHTEGFNPHLYMTYALALSLGFESTCESVDVRLLEEVPFEQVKERINACLPRDIRVLHVQEPVMKPERIAWGDYQIEIRGGALLEPFQELMAQEQILVTKKSKKGEQQVDIKPLVQVLDQEQKGESLFFTLRCATGIHTNINPMLLLDALFQKVGMERPWLSVKRTAIWTKEMEKFQSSLALAGKVWYADKACNDRCHFAAGFNAKSFDIEADSPLPHGW